MLSQNSSRRFLSAVIVLLAAFMLHAKLGLALHWWPDFVLASLITFSFFLGFFELIFLIVITILLFNWQPVPQPEIFLLFILPLSLFFFRKVIFALEGWLSNIAAVFFGILIFYGVSSFSLIFLEYEIFLKDIAVSVLFGFVVSQLFNYFYKEQEA